MNPAKLTKKVQGFKYISQDREKEVYEIFEIIEKSVYSQKQPYLSQGHHIDLSAPLQKFSMLEDEGYTLEIKSSS